MGEVSINDGTLKIVGTSTDQEQKETQLTKA